MLCVFVNSDFEAVVNAITTEKRQFQLLGARLIDNGAHAGERLVDCSLFNSCDDWRNNIREFASGGTALQNGQFIIEDGRTIEFTDPTGTVWGPFTITEADPTGWFNEEEI